MPAIAITIHKSQGSESEKVSILWSQKYIRNQYAVKEKKIMTISFAEVILKEGYLYCCYKSEKIFRYILFKLNFIFMNLVRS